jgi:hypothetical protein
LNGSEGRCLVFWVFFLTGYSLSFIFNPSQSKFSSKSDCYDSKKQGTVIPWNKSKIEIIPLLIKVNSKRG